MPYDFISDNPAISQFNARVAVGDQQRRQEEQDFANRYGIQRAIGADKALREAAQLYPFQQQTQVPVQTPPLAAPITQTPVAPAPVTAAPSVVPTENPDYGGVPPRAAPAPNVAPPAPAAAPGQAPAISSFTAAQPAAVAAPQPQPPPQQPNPYGPMVARLAQTPGTGSAAMGLVTADVTGRRAEATQAAKHQHEGAQMFANASLKGDFATMRFANRQYNLGIPEQILNNKEISAHMATGMNIARNQFGKTDPAQAIAFSKGFVEALAEGKNELDATRAGMAESEKVNPTQVDVAKERAAGRVAAAGGAGAGSKQQQYAEWRIKTLTQAGMPPDQAQQLVAGGAGTRPMTAQQRLSLAKGLMSAKGPNGISPLYKNFDEALKAIDTAVAPPQQPGQGPLVANIPDDAAAQARALELDAQGKQFNIGVGHTPQSTAQPAAAAPKIPKYDPLTGKWSDQ